MYTKYLDQVKLFRTIGSTSQKRPSPSMKKNSVDSTSIFSYRVEGLKWPICPEYAAIPSFKSRKIDRNKRAFRLAFLSSLLTHRTATAGSDVVQSGRPIFDEFFQHLWPYIGHNTANVVFQIIKRFWLIRIDQ
ncbi:hypothetical protein TNCV_2222121 [Trichonephila clavipes]|nr:hypothetical protein TNCV_2222121 [Trichonephila clavipes]